MEIKLKLSRVKRQEYKIWVGNSTLRRDFYSKKQCITIIQIGNCWWFKWNCVKQHDWRGFKHIKDKSINSIFQLSIDKIKVHFSWCMHKFELPFKSWSKLMTSSSIHDTFQLCMLHLPLIATIVADRTYSLINQHTFSTFQKLLNSTIRIINQKAFLFRRKVQIFFRSLIY